MSISDAAADFVLTHTAKLSNPAAKLSDPALPAYL